MPSDMRTDAADDIVAEHQRRFTTYHQHDDTAPWRAPSAERHATSPQRRPTPKSRTHTPPPAAHHHHPHRGGTAAAPAPQVYSPRPSASWRSHNDPITPTVTGDSPPYAHRSPSRRTNEAADAADRTPSSHQRRMSEALRRVDQQFQRLSSVGTATNGGAALAAASVFADALDRATVNQDARVRELVEQRAREVIEKSDYIQRSAVQDLIAPIRDAVVECASAVADMDDWLQRTWPLISDARQMGSIHYHGGSRLDDAIDAAVQRALVRLAGRGALSQIINATTQADARGASVSTLSNSPPQGWGSAAADGDSSSVGLRGLRRALRDEIADERGAREAETDTLHDRLDGLESRLRGLDAAVDNLRMSYSAASAASHHRTGGDPTDTRRLHPDDVHLVQRMLREAEPGLLAKMQASMEPSVAHVKQVSLTTLQSSEASLTKATNAVALELTHVRDTARRDARDLTEKLHILRSDVQKALADVCRSVNVACPVV